MSDGIPDGEDVSIPSSVDDATTEYVAKTELRALIAEWRRKQESGSLTGQTEIAIGFKQCADDLEKLLRESEGD